jgi:predicted PurR-regulated permease PerM
MPKKIEISHRTILFTLGLLIGLWLFLQVRDIVYLLFVSYILMSAIRPIVAGMTKFRIPQVLAILLLYCLLFAIVAGFLGSVLPTIIVQTTKLVSELPHVASQVIPSLEIDARAVAQQVAPLTQNVVQFGLEVFNHIVAIVSVLVFTLYLLLERNRVGQLIEKYMPEAEAKKIESIMEDVEERLGAWARGQAVLMITIGILTYIGLSLLHVDYALPLALFAGFLEVIPMVGPLVGSIPAILLSLSVSPLFALTVAALYFVIQQLENHLIVPYVMRKSVGISPILTILAFMVGARFGGVIGALLAIPAIVVAQTILSHWLGMKKDSDTKAS